MAAFATKRTGASLRAWKPDMSGMLRLAAAPTFALMGGIAAVSTPGMTICTAALPWSPINDMALMYLLMAIFHLPPWLVLVSARLPRQTQGDQ